MCAKEQCEYAGGDDDADSLVRPASAACPSGGRGGGTRALPSAARALLVVLLLQETTRPVPRRAQWRRAQVVGTLDGTWALLCPLLSGPQVRVARTRCMHQSTHTTSTRARNVRMRVQLVLCARSSVSIPRFRQVDGHIFPDRPVGRSNFGQSGVQTSAV